MRFLIFVFSFLISKSLLGQIIFEPTFINQCTNQIDESPSWVITDLTKTNWHWPDNNNSNQATLPKSGDYKIYINYDAPIEFTVNEFEITRDTFFIKRLIHYSHYGSHPLLNYSDCDSLANGKISDYYYNGKIRRKGSFKNGKGIDTLFSYFKSGQQSGIVIPKKKGWKRINYFKNGKIKSEEIRSKKKKSTLKEYFPNGILKRNQSHKKLEIYNQKKVVIEKMKRKEILIFERLFKKKKHGREKFYAYQWESFDDRGIIKRKMIFDSDHFDTSPFPDSVQQIDDFLFEEIIFYFNGKEFKKVALELESRKNLSRKLVVYRKEEKKWTREKTTSINKIHSLIENYSN